MNDFFFFFFFESRVSSPSYSPNICNQKQPSDIIIFPVPAI